MLAMHNLDIMNKEFFMEFSRKYNFEILSKIKKINPEIKWFKSFQLEKIKMKKMNEISGGEQQKVFLSRVMSIETNVIIMDEPNQYLDEHLYEVFAIIKSACKQLMGTEYNVMGQKMKWEMITQ